MYESRLRDLIAKDISKLEEGLILLQKEKYIPNPLGTKGFIDLYAKDNQENHVLIELKRSGASAREAIHEIYKYVEGVKSYLGVKDNEIRVIIASTEWQELLAPFSGFVSDTSLNVKGLQININNLEEISVSPIQTLPIVNGRFIAPWHDMCWYLNENSFNDGVLSMENSCKAKGIEDFIIVLIRLEQPAISEKEASMKDAIFQMASLNGVDTKSNIELPAYKFIAYFAMQILTRERCLQILKADQEKYDEAQEIILNSEDEDDDLCFLHESVISLIPSFKSDFYEIGYPAKINKYLEEPNCIIQEIKRYGIFDRNQLLDDATILSELKGEDGSTEQRLKRSVSVSNRAQMASAYAEIKLCLKENSIWKSHILRSLDEIESQFPMAEVDLSIYNPATGVFTIYFTTTLENGILYIPSYYLLVRNPEPVRMYFGGFEDNGHALTFHGILDKYYDGKLENLLISRTWGGKDFRDLDITEDLGCTYRSYRCDFKGEERSFFSLSNDRWRECAPIDPSTSYFEYLEKNEKLVHQIIGKILPRDNGGTIDASSSAKAFDVIADIDRGKKLKDYYINPPKECDLCKCELTKGKYMVDGGVKGLSVWANMCQDCAVYLGTRIGWGSGQLYLNHNGKWLLVGGFNSESEEEQVSKP